VAVAFGVNTIGCVNRDVDGGVIGEVATGEGSGAVEVCEDSAEFKYIRGDRSSVARGKVLDFLADVITCFEEEDEVASEGLVSIGADWGCVSWCFEEVGERWGGDWRQ
jgi:hypothetical protein